MAVKVNMQSFINEIFTLTGVYKKFPEPLSYFMGKMFKIFFQAFHENLGNTYSIEIFKMEKRLSTYSQRI